MAQLSTLGIMAHSSPKKKLHKMILISSVFLGVIVLYVLSIGPAYWLLCKGVLPQQINNVIYDPITGFCRQSLYLDNLLHRYEDWWYYKPLEIHAMMPNQSPEPTAVTAAVAIHAASRRWLSFFR